MEATNACRILRTRGETGLLRFLAVTRWRCVEPACVFLAPAVLPVAAGFAADFGVFGLVVATS